MNTRIVNILIGIMFALSGALTLIEGIFNTRASNIFIGVCFVVVGCLYLMRKKKTC